MPLYVVRAISLHHFRMLTIKYLILVSSITLNVLHKPYGQRHA